VTGRIDLPRASVALKAVLDAMPGAVAGPMTAARGSEPLVMIYKIMGRMFAILSLRADPFVILKCDPLRADMLRESYRGIGHRSHLDRRYWISVDLEADVPTDEIHALIAHSWDQVAAGLTRKQRAELESLQADPPSR
jgi:predicted DNA-binding protein (MmcQ/YjbR family)